jgi:hypothetical protein
MKAWMSGRIVERTIAVHDRVAKVFPPDGATKVVPELSDQAEPHQPASEDQFIPGVDRRRTVKTFAKDANLRRLCPR